MKNTILLLIFASLILACSTQNKIKNLETLNLKAKINIGMNNKLIKAESKDVIKDTLIIKEAERDKQIIMKAVKEENGEMVATDVIKEAKVTARFRNIAERNGCIKLYFDITVPKQMLDRKWQLRFTPTMIIMNDSIRLEPLIITGNEYRKQQLRGYEQYQKFLKSISQDSLNFVMWKQLEVFIERNIPQLYKFKHDSSYVSDIKFKSFYNISEEEALAHYRNQYIINRNLAKLSKKDMMFKKYVKVPISIKGIKLDTILHNIDGDFIYRYTKSIKTAPKLKKIDIFLSGDIFLGDRKIYSMKKSENISYYISSLSSLADKDEKHIIDIIYRSVKQSTACYIDFDKNSSYINKSLAYNNIEIKRICTNLRELLLNKLFDIDSIIVTASCSPEGNLADNIILAKSRAKSVKDYFNNIVKHLQDSIRKDKEYSLYTNKLIDETKDNISFLYKPRRNAIGTKKRETKDNISFLYKYIPENWESLNKLIKIDSKLSDNDKYEYMQISQIIDLDKREKKLQKCKYYPYIRKVLYPRLRIVVFNFYLHRKNMQKDSVYSDRIDNKYMTGLKALENRDYKTALSYLKDYNDFNTALAYTSMNYNLSALRILNKLSINPKIKYLYAIIYSRLGEYHKAIDMYLSACEDDKQYVYRGNLDPEISTLINKFSLNKQFNN